MELATMLKMYYTMDKSIKELVWGMSSISQAQKSGKDRGDTEDSIRESIN